MQFDSSFDYTKTDENTKPVVDGDYDAIVAEDTALVATSSGRAGIKLRVRLTNGPDGSINRTLTDTLGYHQDGTWKLAQVAEAAGVDRPSDPSEAGAKDFIESLVGKEMRVRIKNGTYTKDGEVKPNLKIDRYLAQNAAAGATPLAAAGGRRTGRR